MLTDREISINKDWISNKVNPYNVIQLPYSLRKEASKSKEASKIIKLFDHLKYKINVSFRHIENTKSNGYTDISNHEIWINPKLSVSIQVGVLCHEVVHFIQAYSKQDVGIEIDIPDGKQEVFYPIYKRHYAYVQAIYIFNEIAAHYVTNRIERDLGVDPSMALGVIGEQLEDKVRSKYSLMYRFDANLGPDCNKVYSHSILEAVKSTNRDLVSMGLPEIKIKKSTYSQKSKKELDNTSFKCKTYYPMSGCYTSVSLDGLRGVLKHVIQDLDGDG